MKTARLIIVYMQKVLVASSFVICTHPKLSETEPMESANLNAILPPSDTEALLFWKTKMKQPENWKKLENRLRK